jgi:multisubunit Na+/H+ antiporter MnhG subunit
MVARLGNALYWAGCVLAILIIGFGILAFFNDPIAARRPGLVMVVTATSSVVIWLVGRAIHYVLTGT